MYIGTVIIQLQYNNLISSIYLPAISLNLCSSSRFSSLSISAPREGLLPWRMAWEQPSELANIFYHPTWVDGGMEGEVLLLTGAVGSILASSASGLYGALSLSLRRSQLEMDSGSSVVRQVCSVSDFS